MEGKTARERFYHSFLSRTIFWIVMNDPMHVADEDLSLYPLLSTLLP